MADKDLLSTVKYVSGTTPSFLLSGIAAYLDSPQTVDQIYAALRPHLPDLRLVAEKTGNDYRISRLPESGAHSLGPREEKRIGAYLTLTTLPPALESAIEDYIGKKTGKAWSDPVVLKRLRRAIVAQKDDYWKPTHERSLRYTKGYAVLGYLAYHFPVYFMQTRHLLGLLARDGLLKKEMNILDLGTGPGVVPLAVADFWRSLDAGRATVHTVERSREHIEAFTYLAEHVVPDHGAVTVQPPVEADITRPDLLQHTGPFDMVVFSNVLNELAGLPLEQRADLVMEYAGHLSPDGTILVVEPAEEAASTGLRVLSLALKKRGLTIYAPCTYVWGTNCTPARCWSFTTGPSLQPTRIMNGLAACDELFRYVNTDIKYSYVMLRRDGKTRNSCTAPKKSRAIRLSRIHMHAGKRVTVIAAKMSGDLGEKETRLYKICDGSAEKPVYAVLPKFHITPASRELISASYGTVLELRDVLVRYNPEHDAWNVLVGRDSGVHTLSKPDDPLRSNPGPIRPPIGVRHAKKKPGLGSDFK